MNLPTSYSIGKCCSNCIHCQHVPPPCNLRKEKPGNKDLVPVCCQRNPSDPFDYEGDGTLPKDWFHICGHGICDNYQWEWTKEVIDAMEDLGDQPTEDDVQASFDFLIHYYDEGFSIPTLINQICQDHNIPYRIHIPYRIERKT